MTIPEEVAIREEVTPREDRVQCFLAELEKLTKEYNLIIITALSAHESDIQLRDSVTDDLLAFDITYDYKSGQYEYCYLDPEG